MIALCASSAPAALHAPRTTRRDALGLGLTAAAAPHAAPVAAASSKYASTTTLADGLSFPLASFGLQIYDDATAEKLTRLAIEAGFRNFFASVLAQNQRGFARGVKASGIARDELFICGSVVSNRALDADTAYKLTALGCAENLEAFSSAGITTLDMIMLDYPGQDDDCIRAQWRAFEDFKAEGGAKSLALSNFNPKQLDAVLLERGRRAKPTVNQLPYCVGYHDPGIVAANQRRGLHVQAWSPLGNGRLTRFLRDAPEAQQACAAVGARYGKSAYQVALRWITQSGASFTVEAKSAAHFAEDLALFDWQLDQEDMARLEAINKQPYYEKSVTAPDA
jgi:diketogulonate reductase-like aldo/keto reductase|eukprot:Transcript_1982.p1 GENE.Transcript_1982~~Transcript_1982.p1  ORF type:complete len:337 (+),score=137.15 Transcript_1982:167-1177(+)